MRKLQLAIPEPCHENWQKMTPTDQGRFCNACAKEVVDFSVMTDKEVLNFFTNPTHEKVCGRALPEQLNRTITMPKEPKKRLFWYWNYIVMFCMFFGKGNSAKAQGAIKQVSTEQLAPNLALNLDYAVKGKVGGPFINSVRLVKGKITTEAGEPIPFATVTIKGTNSSLSADANGAFTIKISNSNSVLRVSAVGFKDVEEVVGNQTEINIKLNKQDVILGGEVVITVGGMGFRNSDDYYGQEDKLNRVAVITVRDEAFGNVIEKATVIISKNSVSKSDSTDKKGVYKIKGIKPNEQYNVEIQAAGYEANKLTITDADFKNRKQSWDVLLRKDIKILARSTASPKPADVSKIRMGAVNGLLPGASVVYVVDDVIIKDVNTINPDDIQDLTVLPSAAASALFGESAANGAIVITTKKQKIKDLDTVSIKSFYQTACSRSIMGATKIISTAIEKEAVITGKVSDSLKILGTKITGSLKIYPNPVQRGAAINIEIKLKQAGLYRIQITDAAGRVVLQKLIIATAKEFTEKIMCDERLSSGLYYINLIDSKNKMVGKRSCIFQ